jgi:thioredoxin reductase
MTAAIYAIRKRLDVLLVSQDLGGKTNYRMELPDSEPHQVVRGVEVVEKFWRELDYLDFARRLEPVRRIERVDQNFTVSTADGDELLARSVIVATGSRVRTLGVPGEREYIGRGLSYSAVSYAPLFAGRRTMVIGDGELALKAVTELATLADSVHLVALTANALATPLVTRLATELKVVVWEGYAVREIQGDDYVRQVIIEAPDTARATIEVDGVFIELGLLPNSDPVKGLVDLDEQGRIVIDKMNRTSCPGLFAAGDVTDAFAEQVLIAVGEGAKAALSAYDYLLPEL